MTAHTYQVSAARSIRLITGTGINERCRALETLTIDLADAAQVAAVEALGFDVDDDLRTPTGTSGHHNPFALTPNDP